MEPWVSRVWSLVLLVDLVSGSIAVVTTDVLPGLFRQGAAGTQDVPSLKWCMENSV